MSRSVAITSDEHPSDRDRWKVPSDCKNGAEIVIGWPIWALLVAWSTYLALLVQETRIPESTAAGHLLAMSAMGFVPLSTVTVRRAHLIEKRKLWPSPAGESVRMVLIGAPIAIVTAATLLMCHACYVGGNTTNTTWAMLGGAGLESIILVWTHSSASLATYRSLRENRRSKSQAGIPVNARGFEERVQR